MVAMLMLMSWSIVFTAPVAAAHSGPGLVAWDMAGSNDTGWIRVDLVGADPATGTPATATLPIEFAPGAILSNVTLSAQVDGGNGLIVDRPVIREGALGGVLFDGSDLGVLGQRTSFDAGEPHQGRLDPFSDTGAGWSLPVGSTITDLVLEVLAPVDPKVSLGGASTVEVIDHITHPNGRLYLAISDGAEDRILVLDEGVDPHIIEVLRPMDGARIHDLHLDATNQELLIAADEGRLVALSLEDHLTERSLPSAVGRTGAVVDLHILLMTSNGWMGASDGALHQLSSDGSGWQIVADAGASDWPEGTPTCGEQVGAILMLCIDDGGVARFDLGITTGSGVLSPWSSSTGLHSDRITDLLHEGNMLYIASADSGVARYETGTGQWMATWTTGNWLLSDRVPSLAVGSTHLHILSDTTVQFYDLASGTFVGGLPLEDAGLVGDAGERLVRWENPSDGNDWVLASDGSGRFAILNASLDGNDPLNGVLTVASAPSSEDMTDLVEAFGMIHVASGTVLDRFDLSNQIWLEPILLDAPITDLALMPTAVVVGTDGAGVVTVDGNGTAVSLPCTSNDDGRPGTGNDGRQAAQTTLTCTVGAIATEGEVILATHPGDGFSVIDGALITTLTESDGLPSDLISDAALLGGIAYLATIFDGVVRYDVSNSTFLSTWASTGVTQSDEMPIAMVGDVLHAGLQGYGVVRKDLSTGDILDPLPEARRGTAGVPGNDIRSLLADPSTGSLYVGTNQGAVRYDTTSGTFTSFSGGSAWNGPRNYFDLISDGTSVWAGTNAGACRYTVQSTSIQLDECFNAGDGLPSTAARTLHLEGTDLYIGTWGGVAVFDVLTETTTTVWEAGTNTGNALVEVVDDVAYIGFDNLGVARYDLINRTWLTPWTDEPGGLLAGDGITSMVLNEDDAVLWVGGDFGVQALDVRNGSEVTHIPKSSAAFTGNADPVQLLIHEDVLYHRPWVGNGDRIHRIDVTNETALESLDAGVPLGISGFAWGMGIVDDHLLVSATAWPDTTNGGLARWSLSDGNWTTTITPEGGVDEMEVLTDTRGDVWIAAGDLALVRFDSNFTEQQRWTSDDLELPIQALVEWDGQILAGTEDGVWRYDLSTGTVATTWTSGSGLPSEAEDHIHDLHVEGTELWVGSASYIQQWWGGIQLENSAVSRWNATTGTWSTWTPDSTDGMVFGEPVSIAPCGGSVFVAMSANNGGVSEFDGTSWSSFTQRSLDSNNPNALACDDQEILYVGYEAFESPGISRYDVPATTWRTTLDTTTNGIGPDCTAADALAWNHGRLLIGHADCGSQSYQGGLTAIPASGSTIGSGVRAFLGSDVTSFDPAATATRIAQPGGSTGTNRVLSISSQGLISTDHIQTSLTDGRISMMVGNTSKVFVATGDGYSTSWSVLEGQWLPNGTISWSRGWSSFGGVINDLHLDGTDLWVSISGHAISHIDLTTGVRTDAPTGVHRTTDGIAIWDAPGQPGSTNLVVGLSGTTSTSAGLQVLNDAQGLRWSDASLLAGLPSNIVNDIDIIDDVVYLATTGGVGRFDLNVSEWLNPLTTFDGLGTNDVACIESIGTSTVYLGSSAGVERFDTNSGTLLTPLVRSDGLAGTSTVEMLVRSTGSSSVLMVAHDGLGATRPAVTVISPGLTGAGNDVAGEIHRFDVIPSNSVRAIASDAWGVHIATSESPIVHWNRSSGEVEDGTPSFQTLGWPAVDLTSTSNGAVMMTSGGGVTLLDGRSTDHGVLRTIPLPGARGAILGTTAAWVVAEDGLHGWTLPGWTAMDRTIERRANPLSLGFGSSFTDVSDSTLPGTRLVLVEPDSPVTRLGSSTDPEVEMSMEFWPLTFSSTVAGAATWATVDVLNHTTTMILGTNDSVFASTLQNAVFNAVQANGSREVPLLFSSPSNGSMMVRLQYDWSRSESPIDALSITDRPDDGGGALDVTWSLVHDEEFVRYLVFLEEGIFQTLPDADELRERLQQHGADAIVTQHYQTKGTVETIRGSPLIDGTGYSAVVVVEYAGGELGTPSLPIGPASPDDDVPEPPASASGEPGRAGVIDLEWTRCTALDHAATRLRVSELPIESGFGVPVHVDVPARDGNTTTLESESGVPIWIALTCVDDAGQERPDVATIIGPLVAVEGAPDDVPPPMILGTSAMDVPDDEGGRLAVSWEPSIAEDCAFLTVYIQPSAISDRTEDGAGGPEPSSVEGFSVASIIPDCASNGTTIDAIDGQPLINGVAYDVGVVASDAWLNADLGRVMLSEATPFVNRIGSAEPPIPVSDLAAFDHPDDRGTAIDVSWSPAVEDDFSHYIIWVSEQPIALTEDTATVSNGCGCFRLDQRNPSSSDRVEVTIDRAQYGEGFLVEERSIQPDVELVVVVTVHDVSGNVHVEDLQTVRVTPVDNTLDTSPPTRVGEVRVTDHPEDDGSRLLIDFDLSTSSDVVAYDIYASSTALGFRSVGPSGTGPATPILTVDRMPDLPLSIRRVDGDLPIIAGQPVTVAVVARDASGNAWLTDLRSTTGASIDDGVSDPGDALPEVTDLTAEWIRDGTAVRLTWSASVDATVSGYNVYISETSFEDADDATWLGTVEGTTTVITIEEFEDLSNSTSWYVGVGSTTGLIERTQIQSIELPALSGPGAGATTGDGASFSIGNEGLALGFAAVSALILALAVVQVIRRRRSGNDWALEGTWGIQGEPSWDGGSPTGIQMSASVPPVPPGLDPVGAVPQMTPQDDLRSTWGVAPSRSQPSQVDASLLRDLTMSQPPGDEVDTSFLDDLI